MTATGALNAADAAVRSTAKVGKLEVVPKPNEKAYRDQIDAETKAIEEIKGKIAQLQTNINSVVGGRDEYNRKKGEMRAKLDQIQSSIDQLEDKRKDLLTCIQNKQKEGAEMKQSATELRRKIGFASAEDIDKKIAALEHSMVTTTLSLKEEKQMIENIKKLKNSKPLLGQYRNLEQNASQFEDTAVAPMRAMLDDIRTNLLELKNQKRAEAAKYKEMMDQRQAATAPGKDLFDERDRLSKLMNDHISRRRAIQDEMNHENYRYQAYVRLQRKERDEKMREERARRQLEGEREDLMRSLERVENDLPYEDECNLIQQTIAYLKKVQSEQKETTEETAAAATPSPAIIENANIQGRALIPKDQREQFFFAPKSKKKQNSDSHSKKPKSKTIRYDIGTLHYFEQCGVTAPVLIDEIQGCINQLEEKLKVFKGIQQDAASKVDSRRASLLAQIKTLDEKVAQQLALENRTQEIR